MTEFTDLIKYNHDEEASDIVRTFFEASRLPLPETDAFFYSVDSGLLIFLDKEACVIRLASAALSRCNDYLKKEEYVPIIHSDILQPIGRQNLGDYLYLEVMPGVRVGSSQNEYKDMVERLSSDGFLIDDGTRLHYRNAGLLPDGTPVIIDRGAVRTLSDSVQDIKENLRVQNRFFGSLAEAFNKAWPEYAYAPKKDLLSVFWRKCRDMKENGLLVTGWHQKFSGNYVTDCAKNYHLQRQQYTAG